MQRQLNSESIVYQDVLRGLESLCVQDEPPACTAACPLHLDVRAMLALAAKGDLAGAFKLFQKAVPFAGVVAYTCDAPCRGVCRRRERGGAIDTGGIEAAAAKAAYGPPKAPFAIPNKPQRVAVIGGGLRGMACADALARKGYKPTLFEAGDRLGGRLRALPETALPASVLEAEIAALLKLPVKVEYGRSVGAAEAPALLEQGFSAVYFACASDLSRGADAETLLTALPLVLAGRRGGRLTEGASSVYDVFDGRSAATTLDRLLQGVSVSAGREKEGSADTRLLTSLEGVADAAPVPAGVGGYSAAQAAEEAARCLSCSCMECVKKCAFLAHYGGHPRRYVREVYNNLSIAMGNHDANGMINTCTLCGRCAEVCPNGLDMSAVFLAARRRMTETGKMPPSAYEFALLDMDESLSDRFFLARHQPGHTVSRSVFFPGCQLAASEPALVEALYADLCVNTEGGVGLLLGCCGVMAHWAGDTAREAAVRAQLARALAELGNPTVIAACPTCARTLEEALGIQAVSLYAADRAPPPAAAHRIMRLHHACGARRDAAVREAVAKRAAECGVLLAPDEGDGAHDSPCCGYGGLLAFVSADLAGEMTAGALNELGDAREPVLTYCVNCRDRYLAAGREAYHLAELLLPDVPGLRRKPPTWSERQDNRAALKRRLLGGLWSEKTEEAARLELYIGDELEQKLERNHILHSDLAAAITHAEAENARFLNPATGRYTASYRPGNVTFWVEYAPEGEGRRVFNAYSHRMDFIVTEKLSEGGADKHA